MRNILRKFVFTLFEKGKLNQIILRWSFSLFRSELACTSFCWYVFSCKAFSYKGCMRHLSNIYLDDDISDNLFSFDFGSCFKICVGWLELMSMYLGSLFGFLYGWYDSAFKLNVTSTKSTDIIFFVLIIDKPHSLNTLMMFFYFRSIRYILKYSKSIITV